jgi:L-ascorbate metabolism protein UlaG (beta-lactamase superfamily)
MIITYLGKQFFKIQQGDLVMAYNPINKDSKFDGKVTRFGASLALSSTNHPDFNGFENVTHGDTIPFEVSGPGDYEIKDIFIKGIMTEAMLSGNKYINTVYSLSIENISLCMLGAIKSTDALSAKSREEIGTPDILFVPISGEDTLSPAEAYKLAVSLDAKIIIPMDYDEKSLKMFLKEGGQDSVKPIEKLTIKSKELAGREGEIIVLQS